MENEALKDVLLQLAALSGEVSEGAIALLSQSERYTTKLLWTMRQDKLIKKSDKDNIIGYRLSQSGKRYLRETCPARYRDYFGHGGITDKVRLDGIHRQRYQRMSEVNAMVYRIGAELFPGTKPPFAVESQSPSQSSQSSQARYYTSFELKDLGDEAIKINPSRAMGLLCCPYGAALLYHTHTGPIKWEEMTECKMRTLIGNMLRTKLRSVMIGQDMACALALLTSSGGKLNRYYKVSTEHQADMVFIPQDRYGIFLLRYAMLTNFHAQLKQLVLGPLSLTSGQGSLVCDGYIDEKTAVLFACDFDMVRLTLFKNGIEVRKLNGIVYCFDFQAETLFSYFGDSVRIRAIPSEPIMEKLGGDAP